MILIFCAFGAELAPLRSLLHEETRLEHDSMRAFQGKVRGIAVTLVATGVGIRRAHQAAAAALDQLANVDAIITTGVAGALRSDLPIGRVVVSDRLMLRRAAELAVESTIEASAELRGKVAAALVAAQIRHDIGTTLTSRRPIGLAQEKRRAYDALGAIAVDMESAVIAQEAARRRMPFIYIRTIMDTAAESLDGAQLLAEDGTIKPLAAAAAIITHPRLIPHSFRLIKNLRLATRSLLPAVIAAIDAIA